MSFIGPVAVAAVVALVPLSVQPIFAERIDPWIDKGSMAIKLEGDCHVLKKALDDAEILADEHAGTDYRKLLGEMADKAWSVGVIAGCWDS